jgi:Fe-S cluster biosynthesis and repair protein YggX
MNLLPPESNGSNLIGWMRSQLTMANVECNKCGKSAVGLEEAPLPGDAGAAVLAHTCVECWGSWCLEQVKLINELSLSPAKPDHYAQLVVKMREFLALQ